MTTGAKQRFVANGTGPKGPEWKMTDVWQDDLEPIRAGLLDLVMGEFDCWMISPGPMETT